MFCHCQHCVLKRTPVSPTQTLHGTKMGAKLDLDGGLSKVDAAPGSVLQCRVNKVLPGQVCTGVSFVSTVIIFYEPLFAV